MESGKESLRKSRRSKKGLFWCGFERRMGPPGGPGVRTSRPTSYTMHRGSLGHAHFSEPVSSHRIHLHLLSSTMVFFCSRNIPQLWSDAILSQEFMDYYSFYSISLSTGSIPTDHPLLKSLTLKKKKKKSSFSYCIISLFPCSFYSFCIYLLTSQ